LIGRLRERYVLEAPLYLQPLGAPVERKKSAIFPEALVQNADYTEPSIGIGRRLRELLQQINVLATACGVLKHLPKFVDDKDEPSF
jgi:hypothetical protein